MAVRVMMTGSVPAGTDANKMFRIGSVPEGMKLIPTSVSYYGGDAGERYNILLVPAGNPCDDTTVDADTGTVGWIYPLGGASYAVTGPQNALTETGNGLIGGIPGPVTIAVSSLAATAAALPVTILGYLEDL